MKTEMFADTVGRVDFVAGVIRMELVSLEPIEEGVEGGPAKGRMEVRQRVIMPVDGFLKSIEVMADLARKLLDAGIVHRNEPSGDAAAPSRASPNF